MYAAIQCIILLACIAICTSSIIPVTQNCQCGKANSVVKFSDIAEIKEYNPRPYCNKREVIVTKQDNSQRCLDPKIFTKGLVQKILTRKAEHAAKMNTTSPKTATASTTVAATSS